MKIEGSVQLWPLRPEYHINGEKFAARIRGNAGTFTDSFPDIGAAMEWAVGVLISYFNWPGEEARETVRAAYLQMTEKQKENQ